MVIMHIENVSLVLPAWMFARFLLWKCRFCDSYTLRHHYFVKHPLISFTNTLKALSTVLGALISEKNSKHNQEDTSHCMYLPRDSSWCAYINASVLRVWRAGDSLSVTILWLSLKIKLGESQQKIRVALMWHCICICALKKRQVCMGGLCTWSTEHIFITWWLQWPRPKKLCYYSDINVTALVVFGSEELGAGINAHSSSRRAWSKINGPQQFF